MFNWFDSRKKTLPVQVLENRNDIDELKQHIAYTYGYNGELTTDTTSCPQGSTDVPNNTTYGFLIDNVGHVFKILGVTSSIVTIKYYATITGATGPKGDKGDPGHAGVCDDALSPTSTNGVQNKVLYGAIIENKTDSLLTINSTLYPSMTALSDANKGNIRYGFTGQSEDDLLNWVKNDAPLGYYHFFWSHGQANGVEVMKASSEYAHVKIVYYFDPSIKINILTAGVWSGWKNIVTS